MMLMPVDTTQDYSLAIDLKDSVVDFRCTKANVVGNETTPKRKNKLVKIRVFCAPFLRLSHCNVEDS